MTLAIVFLAALAAVLAGALLWTLYRLLSARTRLDAAARLAEERERFLAEQGDRLKTEFSELASRLLEDRQNRLAESNASSVRSLFGGLEATLRKYEDELRRSAESNARLGTSMETQVASLQNFATQAQKFTAALVGGSKIQGNLGEEILMSILERSGFRKGREYDAQSGSAGEGRPDVTVYDVRNRNVMFIDSKMNIKDYIEAYNMPGDAAHKAERDKALKRHVDSIKRQIASLASRDYPGRVAPPREGYSNLPLVAMFCPFNAVLESALEVCPDLMQYAFEQKVVLVTPLTLWGYLWLVSYGWKQHEVELRIEEIQKLGQDVIDAIDALAGDVLSAGAAFEGIRKRVCEEKGRMSIRRLARNLVAHGMKPSKGRYLEKLEKESSDDREQPPN